MARRSTPILLFLLLTIFLTKISFSQITTNSANARIKTTFGDSCYIFCSTKGIAAGTLTAKNPMGVSSNFLWEKYDTLAASFNILPVDSLQSTISNLEDGCYRVTVKNENIAPLVYQAWVLNNWIEVTHTEIPDSSSNCVEFKIWANFEASPLRVFNTATNSAYSIRKEKEPFKFIWKHQSEIVSNAINTTIYDLIASNTPVKYDLEITDEFGCTGQGKVDYFSKVTKAAFSVNPMEGEAVLPIAVSNKSINYDSIIWFFYKDLGQIAREIEAAQQEGSSVPVDSIDFILYDDNPTHEYVNSGQYLVKVTTIKINDTGNCYDSTRFEPGKYIKVDDPSIEAPNFFTPNGDGANDQFVIKTNSLKSMTVKIYNRWGGLVHSWKYSNIRSSDYTYEHSIWDGRIGNRMATPGVYFYVIRAVGRDFDNKGKEVHINKEGFFHLFRNKD